ncbi:MAG: hypothetical protein H0V44_10635 [Planctomycetes bacterium]|nr:hypothetical protein [Planctomycetota bacterium]
MPYALALLALVFSLPLAALEVGGSVPAMDDATWISGSAPAAPSQPSQEAASRVSVIDLWSPTNPACRATMPRLTDLAKRHADRVRVLGLCAGDPEAASVFVQGMGSRVGYPIAVVPSLTPFAPSVGAPCTLLVDERGVVLWWGDALNVAEPLARVLDGTFVVEPIPPVRSASPPTEPTGSAPELRREMIVEHHYHERPGASVVISPYAHWHRPHVGVSYHVPFFLPHPPLLWLPWRHCR